MLSVTLCNFGHMLHIYLKDYLFVCLSGFLKLSLFILFLEYLALFKAHCPFWHWNYITLNMCDTTLISIAED